METSSLQGNLWLNSEKGHFIGHGRITLLEHIDHLGSISKAAKAMKMSYKAAWDAVDAMNNIAPQPLITRATGGKGGGGSRLTPYAKELIEVYKHAEAEHRIFLTNLTERISGFEAHMAFFQRISMRTSARNQFAGTITALQQGEVHTEVALRVSEATTIYASITNESVKDLGLVYGSEAYALVKSGWITLLADPEARISARNRLCGEIVALHSGTMHSEVIVEIDTHTRICATVTNSAAKEMKLHLGMNVCGIFKSNSVLLGV